MRDIEASDVGGAERELTKREVKRAKEEHKVASYAEKDGGCPAKGCCPPAQDRQETSGYRQARGASKEV
jgi:hypothetical protein